MNRRGLVRLIAAGFGALALAATGAFAQQAQQPVKIQMQTAVPSASI